MVSVICILNANCILFLEPLEAVKLNDKRELLCNYFVFVKPPSATLINTNLHTVGVFKSQGVASVCRQFMKVDILDMAAEGS